MEEKIVNKTTPSSLRFLLTKNHHLLSSNCRWVLLQVFSLACSSFHLQLMMVLAITPIVLHLFSFSKDTSTNFSGVRAPSLVSTQLLSDLHLRQKKLKTVDSTHTVLLASP